MALHYFWRRIRPFFFVFMAIETAVRLVLLVAERDDLAGTGASQLGALFVGYLFDLSVFCYFCLPLGFYLAVLPQGRHGGRLDRAITCALFFIITFTMMFSAAGEWFFWDEFQARYNFIAVDYLVYTHEVVGNIMESYPVMPLVSIMAILSGFLAYRLWRADLPSLPPAAKRRWKTFALACAACLGVFFALRSADADISDNRYLNEIARNGIYELFSAFRHNELSYDKFYATLPDDRLAAEVQAALGLPAAPGDAGGAKSPLDHAVVGKKPEPRYNLVVITVESLSGDYMKVFGNKMKLTPHLDRLADDSLFFTNLYATGTRTVYGLSAITLGMPPVPGNSIVRQPANGGLASLGAVLREKGYLTKFIYGGFGYFDNMNEFFSANGYDIVDRDSLGKDEITFANVWGVADEDLYRKVMKENDEAEKDGQPFFDMVMTTSNHRPYTYPAGRIDIPSHSGRNGGVKYTDYTINQFLTEAKTHSWFKNTIFVIVADHTAGSAGKSELDPRKYHIPMFIYAPGIVKPAKETQMASQIDIAPTLLGLMGMSYDSRFYGQDLMRAKPGRAFISNYQKLGYLTEEGLIILKPVGVAEYYTRKGDDFTKAGKPPAAMLNRAIAYFQGAAQWKKWSRSP